MYEKKEFTIKELELLHQIMKDTVSISEGMPEVESYKDLSIKVYGILQEHRQDLKESVIISTE